MVRADGWRGKVRVASSMGLIAVRDLFSVAGISQSDLLVSRKVWDFKVKVVQLLISCRLEVVFFFSPPANCQLLKKKKKGGRFTRIRTKPIVSRCNASDSWMFIRIPRWTNTLGGSRPEHSHLEHQYVQRRLLGGGRPPQAKKKQQKTKPRPFLLKGC